MIDVCLVSMPYAAVWNPSIGLSLLKSSLQGTGIRSEVLYPNLWFAEEVGAYANYVVCASEAGLLIGEWTFAAAAFPDFRPDYAPFMDFLESFLRGNEEMDKLLNGRRLPVYLESLREAATAFVDRVAREVLEHEPKIVGCTTTFQQNCSSLALLRRLRELDPQILTLLGGANCEGIMGKTLKREIPWVDFVVSGEADGLFPELCRLLLEKGRDLTPGETPYGVFGPGANGRPSPEPEEIHAPRLVFQNMDDTPVPDYDDYFRSLASSTIGAAVHPGLLIETSRGCWWGEKSHCTFCGLNGKGMAYRAKSPDRVVKEFSDLALRYGVYRFEVVDNILPMSYFDTALPKLAESPFPYKIFYEIKANLRREHVEKLALSGVNYVQPGMESLHDGALALLGKGCTALMNIQLLKLAREMNIYVGWFVLHNIPGESDEWYAEMAELAPALAHLHPPLCVSKVRFHRFSPYHTRPEQYHIELAPEEAYSYVYPLGPEAMTDLAYQFQDVSGYSLGNGNGTGRPGLEKLREAVARWRRRYLHQANSPVLRMTEEGDRVHITDTRPCATEDRHTLEGSAAGLYMLCDAPCSRSTLVKRLSAREGHAYTWEDLQPVVDELKDRRLLIEHGGKLLGLAVPSARVPLPEYEFSRGYILWRDLPRTRPIVPSSTSLHGAGFLDS